MNCVRQATPGDEEEVFRLCVGFATSFVPTHEAFTKTYARLIGDESAQLLVARADDRIVGYLLGYDHPTLFANGPVATIEELTVESEFRHRGVARALMNVFETWATERHNRYVAVDTRRAAGFYEALGYEASGTFYRKMLPDCAVWSTG